MSQRISSTYHRVLTPAVVSSPSQVVSVGALIDSGADESFMDWGLARKLKLCEPLTSPLEAKALDGRLLFKVTHVTQAVKLVMPY